MIPPLTVRATRPPPGDPGGMTDANPAGDCTSAASRGRPPADDAHPSAAGGRDETDGRARDDHRGSLTATSAAASTDQTVSPRDNCGGFNGHVVVSDGSTPTLQLYGEVWDNSCPGSTSVWLAWQSPGYHNIQVQAADESATDGVNYTTVPLQLVPVDIKVTVCSTYGGWHCGTPVSLPDASGGTGSSGAGQGGGGGDGG